MQKVSSLLDFVQARMLAALFTFSVIACLLPAQNQASPKLSRKWYDGVNRLLKGGDGHYYLVRNRSGQFWSFGREGLHKFEIWRFGADLKVEEVVKVGNAKADNQINNAYEVLRAPNGIAFLSVAKVKEGLHELRLCRPNFEHDPPDFDCERLATLHEFVLRLSQPDLRVAYAPDSSFVLVTWRPMAGRVPTDNSTTCLVLNRDLEVVEGPFSPFLGARGEFQLLRIGIMDGQHLMFWVRAKVGEGALAAERTASFHLLQYDIEQGEMREIRLGNTGNVMMDARMHFAEDGSVQVAGWWINGRDPERNAGVYFGEIGMEDTLRALQMSEFSPEIRKEMVPRLQSDGDVWFRPSYNNQLLPTDSGFLYVMHLLGDLRPELEAKMPGNRQDNALITYPIRATGDIGKATTAGFCNTARSDYRETFSWLPFRTEQGWTALSIDFSGIPTIAQSWRGKAFLLPLERPGADFDVLKMPGSEGENWIPAPRLFVQEGPGDFLFLAKSKKHYRLQRLHF